MKRILILFLIMILLSSCAAQTDTVILKATPTPAAPSYTASPQPIEATAVAPSSTPTSPQPTDSPTAAPSSTPTPTPAPTATPAPEQPPLLSELAQKQGKDLEDIKSEQLILVAADGSSCKLYTYEKGEDGIWQKVLGTRGHIGRNGITSGKKEGDGKTPAGIYDLGFAFGHDASPTNNYDYRSITSDSYWIDDPDSAHYNRWVEGTDDKDWSSAENLGKIKTEYALAVLIEYNYSDPTPGAGSAIFLHVDDGTTAGCVAIPKSDLRSILQWLDEDKHPKIILSES